MCWEGEGEWEVTYAEVPFDEPQVVPGHLANEEHLAGSDEGEDGEDDEESEMPGNADWSFDPTEERDPAPGAEVLEGLVQTVDWVHSVKVVDALAGVSMGSVGIEILAQLDLDIVWQHHIGRLVRRGLVELAWLHGRICFLVLLDYVLQR
jgi:hypothetical protein